MKKNKSPLKKTEKALDKYALYEEAVMDSKHDAAVIEKIFKEIRKSPPSSLREDFAGTFYFSYEWVRRHPENKVLAIDLDPVPLAYGEKHHFSRLSRNQQKRLHFTCGNVLQTTNPGHDLITALNFSYCVFKEREILKRYFKHTFQSLKPKGLFFMDLVGGFNMVKPGLDRRKIYRGRKVAFTYLWRQKFFNPITNEADFEMSFKMNDGKMMRNVFTYPWRLWSIPELRDLLLEVGFKDVAIYWENDGPNGDGNGVFTRKTLEENCEVWICYVVGVK